MKNNIQVIERKQTKNTFRSRNFSHLVVSAPTTTKKKRKKTHKQRNPHLTHPTLGTRKQKKKTKKNNNNVMTGPIAVMESHNRWRHF